MITAGTAAFTDRLPPPNLKDLIPRIAPRPVLFIYGAHDQPNVIDLTAVYYQTAQGPKAVWKAPGAGNTGAITAHPREYEQRVTAFFDSTLMNPGRGSQHQAMPRPAAP